MELSPRPAAVAMTAEGGRLARRIAAALGDAEVHGLRGRVAGADRFFTDAARHLRGLFEAGRPIVGVCAAGILVRALGPALGDKRVEPPVLAVSEDGAFVVPLLGAHRGGAALARRIAAATGASVAVTTAGDRRFGIALDDPPEGWTLANPEHYKSFVAALLHGGAGACPCRVPGGWPRALCPGTMRARSRSAWTTGSRRGRPARSSTASVTSRSVSDASAARPRPRSRSSPGAASTGPVLPRKRWPACSPSTSSPTSPASRPSRSRSGVPARFFAAAALEAEAGRLRNPSDFVFREVGCHGVAEGAALAAAGPHGELVMEKTKSARATCAIARAPGPLDPAALGAARGELWVAGVGPGDAGTLTPDARAAIESADHVVGYRRYLDLVAALIHGQRVHPYELGEERARVEKAIRLAAEGERVALVCSGDPGVYAMASLVMEVLEADADPAFARIAIRVLPGVSALQAAAARAGAPVGHDFCAVSLSDLLTPREAIESRLAAAASADFVIALYNPVSKARRETFARALEILRVHRAPETPVVVARNLGREGERVEVVPLQHLDPARIDMMTTLIVGSSETRTFRHGASIRTYTPRGYAVGRR